MYELVVKPSVPHSYLDQALLGIASTHGKSSSAVAPAFQFVQTFQNSINDGARLLCLSWRMVEPFEGRDSLGRKIDRFATCLSWCSCQLRVDWTRTACGVPKGIEQNGAAPLAEAHDSGASAEAPQREAWFPSTRLVDVKNSDEGGVV